MILKLELDLRADTTARHKLPLMPLMPASWRGLTARHLSENVNSLPPLMQDAGSTCKMLCKQLCFASGRSVETHC